MPVGDAAAIRRSVFGVTPAGDRIEQFTLVNSFGTEITLLEFGATIQSLRVADRYGQLDDIALGYDTIDPYVDESPYFGAVVGRSGNRIAYGRFRLDGRDVQLSVNDGPHHLHGGTRGFDKACWVGTPAVHDGAPAVTFVHRSPAGDQGYPGALTAQVTYSLTDRNELVLDYLATTDAPTPVNLTQHCYFNLAGAGKGNVLGHQLTVFASRYTPVGDGLIPTGHIAPVAGTPFDFREPHAIGERIDADDAQLRIARGYDHNFVLDAAPDVDGLPTHAVHIVEPETGRMMDVHTTEPGLQFYSGNFLDGSIVGKGGARYEHRSAVCLESQHFPDSPNHENFPSTILRPGEEYRSRTLFTFGTVG